MSIKDKLMIDRHIRVKKWCLKNIRVGDIITTSGLSGGYKEVLTIDKKHGTIIVEAVKAVNEGVFRMFVPKNGRVSGIPTKMKSVHYILRNGTFHSINAMAKEAGL